MLTSIILQEHLTSVQNVKNVSIIDQEEIIYHIVTSQLRQSLTEYVKFVN